MHPNSQLLFQKYALPLFQSNSKVLEVGPNKYPSTYQEFVENDTIIWETVDLIGASNINLTYVSNQEYSYPIQSNSFDIVFSAQVIEHVKKVWIWVKELARVCKVGGYVIIINPVSWPYHEAPIDCWRIYPEGMKALYEEAGLTVKLSKCESLHLPESLRNYQKLVPGMSYQTNYPAHKSLIKRLLRIPIIYTNDTITIGVKKDQSD